MHLSTPGHHGVQAQAGNHLRTHATAARGGGALASLEHEQDGHQGGQEQGGHPCTQRDVVRHRGVAFLQEQVARAAGEGDVPLACTVEEEAGHDISHGMVALGQGR